MTKRIFWAAAFWTVFGLFSGIFYRGLTHSRGFEGTTQLSVTHTHALALGTLFLLTLLVVERVFGLSQSRSFMFLFWVWNIGLAVTIASLFVKGTMQVVGSSGANSPALSGISGLGHITLTIAFALFFVVLHGRINASQQVAKIEAL